MHDHHHHRWSSLPLPAIRAMQYGEANQNPRQYHYFIPFDIRSVVRFFIKTLTYVLFFFSFFSVSKHTYVNSTTHTADKKENEIVKNTQQIRQQRNVKRTRFEPLNNDNNFYSLHAQHTMVIEKLLCVMAFGSVVRQPIRTYSRKRTYRTRQHEWKKKWKKSQPARRNNIKMPQNWWSPQPK